MNHGTIHGKAAEIRWSYYVAASVGPWTIVVADQGGGGTVTAPVTAHDPYRLEQTALRFVVPRQHGRSWSWPIEEVNIAGGTLTARLGPQE